MIAMLKRATKEAIPVSKAARIREAQGAVIRESRDNKVERVEAVSKVRRAGKVSKEVCLIVIARDNKAICPIASRASRKKLLQARAQHHTTMTRTQNNQKTNHQTGMRILTAA
jgi:hypothetical protein